MQMLLEAYADLTLLVSPKEDDSKYINNQLDIYSVSYTHLKYVDKYKDRYNYLAAARKLLLKNQENKK